MINIYYTDKTNRSGPGKVIDNLIKGLELENENYSINNNSIKKEDLNVFLQPHNLINVVDSEILKNSIIGPNLDIFSTYKDFIISQNYKKFIVPSEWVKKLYMKWLPEEKIEVWPVGIDTDFFSDKSNNEKEFDCLIYFKRRSEEELNFVKNFLKENNQTYNIIKYGNYDESYFIDLISKSRYGFIIDNCESQGIAIQEMMSCNLPLFVWDVEYWNDRGEEYKVNATSIPYWSNKCGVVDTKKENIKKSLEYFLENIHIFKPRDYILENLNLKKQSSNLIKILKN